MTGPIIPAGEWPEWADRHCWDESGFGYFYGVQQQVALWASIDMPSKIPLPPSHDWRVPVMRPQPALASDLAQFTAEDIQLLRKCITLWRPDYIPRSSRRKGDKHGDRLRAEMAAADRLLALIDGQAKPSPLIARQLAEWHEDFGPVTWWAWSEYGWDGEPAWCGTPNDVDWPGYHTHWTPHPAMPMQPTKGEGE